VAGVSVLPLGGCLVAQPLKAFAEARYEPRALASFGILAKYTLTEMVQFFQVLRGELEPPPELKVLAGYRANFERPSPARLAEVDVVLIEPNTTDEIHYGGFVLARMGVVNEVIRPLEKARPEREVAHMLNEWWVKGLIGRDETVRSTLAAKLAPLVPAEWPNADLIRDVLTNAHGVLGDVMVGVTDLVPLVDKPVGLVTCSFQYMPNGRPMHWPPNLREEVVKAGEVFGMPVFEPWRMVKALGVAKTLMPNLKTYRDEFRLPLGDAIVDFAASVAARKAPQAAVPSTNTAPPKRAGLSPAAHAAAVNEELVALHAARLAELGPQESCVAGAYRLRLERGAMIGPQETAIVDLLFNEFAGYDGYAVLRSGLGELALLMAARGLNVTVFEAMPKFRSAFEAGRRRLEAACLIAPGAVELEWGPAPYGPVDGRVLAIGRDIIVNREAEVPPVLQRLRWFDALLIDPARFMRPREADEAQEALCGRLGGLDFTGRRDFPDTGLSWLGKRADARLHDAA